VQYNEPTNDAQIIYGSGTPQQAAARVAFCNITNHCGFKYWEVGNESGGTWETDSNTGNFYGDLGIVAGLGNTAVNRYPAYYCGKLMKYFASGGDTVVTASSDYKLLSAYAARRANGCLTLLVINKSCYTNLNAAINLTGYVPAAKPGR
jgi:alpha-L-arabinofuranosidase